MDIVRLTETRDGYDIDTSGWDAYIASIEAGLPAAVKAFVAVPWRYDFRDPRCLHDARIEQLALSEGEDEGGRANQALLVLQGAWGGRIELRYGQVSRLRVDKRGGPSQGFGDLLLEELVAVGAGTFRHELVFVEGTLLLEFSDFRETQIDVPVPEVAGP